MGESAGSTENEVALDRFVRDLHGEANGSYSTLNVFGNFAALYPIIGGTAAAHALNLASTGAYGMTFLASPTHSANGIDFNGSNQYANTGLRTESLYASGDKSLFIYADNTGGANWLYGQWNAGSGYVGLRKLSDESITGAGLNAFTGTLSIAGTNKCSSIDMNGPTGKIYSDTVNVYVGADSSTTAPIGEMYLGGLNYFNGYDMLYPNAFRCKLFAIGTHMNDAEHAAIHNAITAYQTALGRN